MRGRYTRFLADGLPLFGQQVGGLGLLQIPPMDLGQVEVIKGVASALYGAGAMGGVVNLVSRRPGAEASWEMLANRSTLGATDSIVFGSAPLTSRWSASLLGGGHWQERRDIDDDGWADVAAYERGVLRPRFFWDGGNGNSAFLTAGVTHENRRGGTVFGSILPHTGAPYPEALDTRRYDLGGSGHFLVDNRYLISVRGAAASQRHHHVYGDLAERDRHGMLFGEVSVLGTAGRHTWVAGAAIERDAYDPRDVPVFRYRHASPGLFLQDDFAVASWLTISAGGRADFHSQYGTFLSPRVSALLKSDGWTSRISVGQGFFAPTPLTEETEAAGLSRLVIPQPLKAERGRSFSIDVTRSVGPGSYTVTFFSSRVRNPLHVERADQYELTNLEEAATNRGVELLATLRRAAFSTTATYTYVRSRQVEGGQRVDVPLTPRHSFGVVGMWEEEDAGRIGIECYYTGQQRLEFSPFRSSSQPYLILGVLAEKRLGKFRLFINAENLTDVRQTKWDPLVRPVPGADGRRTVDAWAPLDGRVFNGGIRLDL
jgi:outer membrane receptor for ferrienterochelin and colicins